MLITIWEYMIHTPWWVYVLFAYLMYVGIKATRTRTVTLGKLFIIPAAFVLWGISSVIEVANVSLIHVLLWLASLAVVAGLFYLNTKRRKITINRENKTLVIPGSYGTLISILIIFSSKYYFAAMFGFHPDLRHNISFVAADLVISGTITGRFVGKLLGYLNQYRA